MKDKLAKYYRGESSLEDERALKAAYRKKELLSEPALAYRGDTTPCPPELLDKIRAGIEKRNKNCYRRIYSVTGGIAATLLIVFGLHLFFPAPPPTGIKLSEQIQRERFENALRVVATVVNGQTTDHEKIVYEDKKLIIAIE